MRALFNIARHEVTSNWGLENFAASTGSAYLLSHRLDIALLTGGLGTIAAHGMAYRKTRKKGRTPTWQSDRTGLYAAYFSSIPVALFCPSPETTALVSWLKDYVVAAEHYVMPVSHPSAVDTSVARWMVVRGAIALSHVTVAVASAAYNLGNLFYKQLRHPHP